MLETYLVHSLQHYFNMKLNIMTIVKYFLIIQIISRARLTNPKQFCCNYKIL